jgi:hypothetical protein
VFNPGRRQGVGSIAQPVVLHDSIFDDNRVICSSFSVYEAAYIDKSGVDTHFDSGTENVGESERGPYGA